MELARNAGGGDLSNLARHFRAEVHLEHAKTVADVRAASCDHTPLLKRGFLHDSRASTPGGYGQNVTGALRSKLLRMKLYLRDVPHVHAALKMLELYSQANTGLLASI